MPSDTPQWQTLLESFGLLWPVKACSVGVLVGCSGGADSVGLVRLIDHAFRKAEATSPAKRPATAPPLIIAHFNHRLRASESDADERLVRDLADSLNRTCIVGTPPPEGDASCDESSLRNMRRRFFVKTARHQGCRYIATAHTAGDQAETVLHHVLRGTGSQGLTGMQPATPIAEDFVVLRPLLASQREQIRAAMSEIGQTWREDASNQDSRYTRNWLRNDVMPLIRTRLPQVNDSLLRLSANQSMTQDLLAMLADQWLTAFHQDGPRDDTGFTSFFRKPSLVGSAVGRNAVDRNAVGWNTVDWNAVDWNHDLALAVHPAVITCACQTLFARKSIPRGEMSQTHWIRLANWIRSDSAQIQNRISRGHLPGHIEVFETSHQIELAVPNNSPHS